MTTKNHYFRGTCKWAKVHSPDEKYQNYSIVMYLDEPSWREFKASGLKLTVKEDEDGENITFRRPVEKTIKGEVVKFGPPGVFMRDDEAEKGMTPTEELIGNGSDVVVKVSVYDTFKGKGHRLEVVLVNKLVEYNPSSFAYKFNDDQPNHNVDKSSGIPF